MEFSDIQTLGIIGGLALTALGLFFNAFTNRQANVYRKLGSYQELIKSHRELWKLTLDAPEKYNRVLDKFPELDKQAITHSEDRFVQLIFHHMTSAFFYHKKNSTIEIEKLKFDFEDFLSYPIPFIVWNQNKKFHNSDFIKYVEGFNWWKTLFFGNKIHMKQYKILALTAFQNKIEKTLTLYGDLVIFKNSQDKKITKEFIKENDIDLIVCFGYRKILSKEVLDCVAAINIHWGYLPFTRGPNPNLWTWIEDVPRGITIHYIDEGVDTGDIIVQKEIGKDRLNDLTVQSSFDEIIIESSNLFKENWSTIRMNKNERFKQQGIGSRHTYEMQQDFADMFNDKWMNKSLKKYLNEYNRRFPKSDKYT